MNVQGATSTLGQTTTTNTSQTNSNSDSSAGIGSGLNGNSFIALLSAQLKAQDPTNPMDPNQFVSELVQFNMLQQLINIDQAVTPATGSASTTGTGGTGTTGTTPTQSEQF